MRRRNHKQWRAGKTYRKVEHAGGLGLGDILTAGNLEETCSVLVCRFVHKAILLRGSKTRTVKLKKLVVVGLGLQVLDSLGGLVESSRSRHYGELKRIGAS